MNMAHIEVKGTSITIYSKDNMDFISLTDMLKAKDGDFFISDWLRNRNTVEFLGIWEHVHNPAFNYGEFATIKSQAGLWRDEHPRKQGKPDKRFFAASRLRVNRISRAGYEPEET